MSYDVIMVGGGIAGLTAAALLADEGKRVLVCEHGAILGGRALEVPDEEFKVMLGGHLLEDGGSGITRIFEHLGKELIHAEVSTEMPVWDHEREGWISVRDRYSSGDKRELKKVIRILTSMPFEELDAWDDQPLRAWLLQHTDDMGVIDLFEFLAVLEYLTDSPHDHAASDNLYSRKMHYEERHTAGYSTWPGQGWDGLAADLADAVIERGGEIRTQTTVTRVVIENEAVVGVLVARSPRVLPNEILEEDLIAAECVISTLPVWNVLDVVPEDALPDWYAGQIKFLAQDRFRTSWLGLYFATEEPIYQRDPRELAAWQHDPVAGLSGFLFTQSAMDPGSAPPGIHLHVMGGIIPAERASDRRYLEEMFPKFEEGLFTMYPGLRNHVWRRRHLVYKPSYNVVQKPGLVGRYRPHWRAPNVEGLFFASETFRSRGIGVDRAARAALTVVEDYLGRRLAGFEETWRY